MLQLIVFLVMVVFSSNCFAKNAEVINLVPESTIVLRDVVTQHSVSRVILSLGLNKSQKVYLYINSPGGDIVSGLSLMNVIRAEIALGREIICIADYAASMAFSILQACSKRIVTESAIIMQHQALFGMRDKLLNLREEMKLNELLAARLNSSDSQRMGMPIGEFQSRIANDWWMFGDEALKFKAADSTAVAKCSAALLKVVYMDTMTSQFGTVVIHWNACPLVYEPLKVDYQPAPGIKMDDFRKWLDELSFLAQWKEKREVR